MIYLVALLINVALVASLTRLVTSDDITAPWRAAARTKLGLENFWIRALDCDRCASVWVSWLPTAGALALMVHLNQVDVLTAVVSWVPLSLACAYLSFLLILRGEN